MTERVYIEAEEAAHALGVSTALLYKEARAGRLPHIRVGRRVR